MKIGNGELGIRRRNVECRVENGEWERRMWTVEREIGNGVEEWEWGMENGKWVD